MSSSWCARIHRMSSVRAKLSASCWALACSRSSRRFDFRRGVALSRSAQRPRKNIKRRARSSA
eukprot:3763745-Rhodomonas_salina.1